MKDLSADTLRPYTGSVLRTAGCREDYRYFLPRILEIACTEGFGWPDLEVVAGSLRAARWLKEWPASEREAVRSVLWAVWRRILATPVQTPAPGLAPDIDIDTALGAIACAEDDLTPYLRYWTVQLRGGHTICAVSQLCDLLTHHVNRSSAGWLPRNAFWPSGSTQLSAWLDGEELREVVTAAFAASEELTQLELLLMIDQHLRTQ